MTKILAATALAVSVLTVEPALADCVCPPADPALQDGCDQLEHAANALQAIYSGNRQKGLAEVNQGTEALKRYTETLGLIEQALIGIRAKELLARKSAGQK